MKQPAHDSTLEPRALTWTALLGQWVQFAQASLAIPEEADGPRWRDSIAAAINLQAVTCALREIDVLPAAERGLARDRAELLIAEAERALRTAWRGAALPGGLVEMIDDAHAALRLSQAIGTIELRWQGPTVLVMPDTTAAIERAIVHASQARENESRRERDHGHDTERDSQELKPTLAVMQPGTLVMPSEPLAWMQGLIALELRGLDRDIARVDVDAPRQVYRQSDTSGHMVRDVVALLDAEPPPEGFPLLMPIIAAGQRIGGFTLNAAEWLQQQRARIHQADGRLPVIEQSL